MAWRYPVDNRYVPYGGHFLSTYTDAGPRALPHSGLDHSRYAGSPIYVVGPGTVVAVGTNDSAGWGNYVYIDHGDIGDGTGRHAYSYYAHMRDNPPAVGTQFSGGEVIGYIGRTGSGITGAHLHWGIGIIHPSQLAALTRMDAASRQYLVDPAAFVDARTAVLEPTQRRVKANLPALRRLTPDRSQPAVEPSLPPNEVGNFNGWIRGEYVDSNGSQTAIWFRGISGNWFWAGGFTSEETTGLEDLNPKPPTEPSSRTIRADIPNARARKTAAAVGEYVEIAAGATITALRFRRGQAVDDGVNATDIWYATADGYVWAGSCTSQSIEGIEEETSTQPEPEPEPTWPEEPFTFVADLAVVDRVVPADWSNFENPWSVPDVTNPDGTVTNPRKGFPERPEAVVWHQWGDPIGTPESQRDSVLREATTRHENTGDRKSWHFVVTEDEIIEQVPRDERAYHAGAGGNSYIGVECDPRMTPGVIANIRRLRAALHAVYGAELQDKLHRDLPGASTSCGYYIEPHLAEITAPEPTDPTDPTTPPFDPDEFLAKLVAELGRPLTQGQTVDAVVEALTTRTKIIET